MQDDAKKTIPEDESIAKYTIKDSVFSDLFKIKKYLMQLYRALYPEDKTATESELTDITIKNDILSVQIKTYIKVRRMFLLM